MRKSDIKIVRLMVGAKTAMPTPPVGPVLGQLGLNIMDFCKKFNDATKDFEKGVPLPVIITVFKNKTFEFIIKKPTTSYLILKKLGLEKGSTAPGKIKIASMAAEQVEEVAKSKMEDLTSYSLAQAINSVKGTARSMGIECQ